MRYPNGDEVEYVVTVFECEVRGGELIASNDETKTLAYFRREDMPALELSYPRAIFDDGRPTAFFA